MRPPGFKATLASIGIAALLIGVECTLFGRVWLAGCIRSGGKMSHHFKRNGPTDRRVDSLSIWCAKPHGGKAYSLNGFGTQGSSETALKNEDVDLWPLITITPERQKEKRIYISKPYLQHDHSLLVRANSPYADLSHFGSGTISHLSLPINVKFLSDLLPSARLVAVGSDKEAIDDVCAGKTDAAFLDQFTASSILFSGSSSVRGAIARDPFPGPPVQVGRGLDAEGARRGRRDPSRNRRVRDRRRFGEDS